MPRRPPARVEPSGRPECPGARPVDLDRDDLGAEPGRAPATTLRAEASETSCSLERPPASTAIAARRARGGGRGRVVVGVVVAGWSSWRRGRVASSWRSWRSWSARVVVVVPSWSRSVVVVSVVAGVVVGVVVGGRRRSVAWSSASCRRSSCWWRVVVGVRRRRRRGDEMADRDRYDRALLERAARRAPAGARARPGSARSRPAGSTDGVKPSAGGAGPRRSGCRRPRSARLRSSVPSRPCSVTFVPAGSIAPAAGTLRR